VDCSRLPTQVVLLLFLLLVAENLLAHTRFEDMHVLLLTSLLVLFLFFCLLCCVW